jgi:hypothetical protein
MRNEFNVKKLRFTPVIKKKLTEDSNHSEKSTEKLAHCFTGLFTVRFGRSTEQIL